MKKQNAEDKQLMSLSVIGEEAQSTSAGGNSRY